MTGAAGEYSTLAKLIHWVTAALVLFMVCLGLWMTQAELPLMEKFQLYQLHKSIGFTILGLTAMRAVLRFISPAPPLPTHMSAWEKFAASSTHFILYALLLAMTLTGWAVVSTAAFAVPTVVFGVIPIPHIPFLEALPADQKKALEPVFETAHAVLAWTLTAFAALHIGAALRHGLFLKDGVMSRMLPRFARRAAILLVTAAGAFSVLFATPGHAFEWDVDTKTSTLGFEANAGGQAVKGMFRSFTSEVRFDADMPADAEVAITIDTASAVTGTREVDAELPKPEWFNAKEFPKAVFRGKGAKEDGNAFALQGQLTLRGVTKPVSVPFTLDIDGGSARAQGTLTLSRKDFGIGPAVLAGGIPLADDVKIAFDLNASRLDN